MNSSTGDLKDKVKEEMLKLNPTEQGGPTYFFLMMEEILSLNDKARRSMIDCLKNTSLRNFEGKNMEKATTQILGT
eukprot:13088030-Ditylum_brightwellii.AAC.1